MPEGSHNSSFGIARGPAGTRSPVVDLKEVPISKEEQERRREEMLSVCTGCHSRRFAQEQLENADQVKEAGFKLMEEGKESIQEIAKGGLLYPSVVERMPHPTEAEPWFSRTLTLYGTSYIERLFSPCSSFTASECGRAVTISALLIPMGMVGRDAT